MKKRIVSSLAKIALAVFVLGGLSLTIGCQTSGKVVSAENSTVCPTCKMETRTAPIKGMIFTKDICPSCKTVTKIDPLLPTGVQVFLGDDIGTMVHVCDHCQAMVEKCPVCRQQK
ncbi:MAG: hypothetical protein R6X19_04890 [Kiritimatiellia bacterium]